jgi:acyl carrier protein
MQSEQELLVILKAFLKNRLDIETSDVDLDTDLTSLGIDSLMQMELVFDFEDKFGFHMPEIQERPQTVGALVALIQTHLPAPVK